jgi:lipoprotein-releasing system permease protein
MNFPFYIARRYLISKKSRQAINIITLISIIGVSVGTMGLIIVLSVFNGFEQLIVSLYNSFDPDISISIKEGKVFRLGDVPVNDIKRIKGVAHFTEVLEENALIRYGEKQNICTLKGVSGDFAAMTGVDTMMTEGELLLEKDSINFAVPGLGIADALNISTENLFTPLDVYVPKRGKYISMIPEEAFNHDLVRPSGVFSIQQDFDSKYVLVPVRFIRGLLNYSDEVSSIELGLDKNAQANRVQEELKALMGDRFEVKNRQQQHELLYKIMKSEKWAVYLILTFILVIATFNVIGSLTMLILDKKRDTGILWSMGADTATLRKIFLIEGLMISLVGALTGLLLGLVICYLQQRFGLLRMGGSFVVEAYPVNMQLNDFLYVLGTVLVIGLFAAWYPAKKLIRQKTASSLL